MGEDDDGAEVDGVVDRLLQTKDHASRDTEASVVAEAILAYHELVFAQQRAGCRLSRAIHHLHLSLAGRRHG